MSKLEELIAGLCPDGVEYRMLYEVADITMGTSPSGRTISTDPASGIEFHQGKSFFGNMMLGHSNMYTSEPVKEAEAGSIVMSVRAPVGDTNITDRKIAIGRGLCGITGKEGLETKFLYYHLNACVNEIKKKSTGSTFEAINTNDVKSIRIPLPPLAVQREIVRILDNFTELTSELAARKKQYDYYRNMLLNFNKRFDYEVLRITLGEIFDIRNGYTPSKSVSEYWEQGTIPWIRMEDIRANGRILSDAVQHITPKAVKGSRLFPANSLIISTTATIGEHALVTVDFLTNQQITCLTIKNEYKQKLNVKYAFYCCFNLGEWCKKNVNKGGGLPIINSEKLKKYTFTVPPLEEQARIVAILDRFDALCNDLSSGLPAEIGARRKQYEYYRDRLLTFREKTP